MVDRYQSLLDNSSSVIRNHNSSIRYEKARTPYEKYIEKGQQSISELKKKIKLYQRATTTSEQKQLAEDFRDEQRVLKRNRQELAIQFHNLKKHSETPQFLFIKEELLKIVKNEMSVDVEMKDLIEQRQQEKEIQSKKYNQGSTQLKNAINDIKEKRDQILYLQRSVNECLELLELIGILVFENGRKIDEAFENIEKANRQIGKALDKIEVAKIRTQRSTNRKCCIIIIGLIAIALILVVLFTVVKF